MLERTKNLLVTSAEKKQNPNWIISPTIIGTELMEKNSGKNNESSDCVGILVLPG